MESHEARSLAGEELEESQEEREQEESRLVSEASALEGIRAFSTDPQWPAFEAYVYRFEAIANEELLNTARTEVQMERLRAQILTFRWIRETPDRVHDRLSEIRDRLNELEHEEEPDA